MRRRHLSPTAIPPVLVKIDFVNGDFHEFAKGAEFLLDVSSLQAQGLSGKQLIHRLLKDDWAAPPRVVEIEAPTMDVLITIPYH
jgi:hypothetical protein